jgi:hypothetical protein
MTEPVTIGIGATKWVKDASTKMITLNRALNSGTHDMTLDGVAYTVPVGKKLIIINMTAGGYQQYFGGVGCNFYKSTTSAGTTTLLLTLCSSWGQHTYDTSAGGYGSVDTYIEVAAGNYIVASTIGTSGSGTVTGVETDA